MVMIGMKLKDKLESFLVNFDAWKINEYFANGEFVDDCDAYFEQNEPTEVLDYLGDSFCDIDIDYRDTNQFAVKVKETILIALEMLETAE